MTRSEVNEDLKKFLENCEEEFKDRYSDKDTDYINYCKSIKNAIPLEGNWYRSHSRFDDRRDDRRGEYRRGGDHRDDRRGEYRDDRRGEYRDDRRGEYRDDRNDNYYVNRDDNRTWRNRDRYHPYHQRH